MIRDDDFLDAVITAAKKHDLPVELAGSILGHAYYRLQREGITVYETEPYSAYFRVRGRKVFHKLVRDQIPQKISRGGERAIQARVVDDDASLALLAKLIEEGMELARAKNNVERGEELADMFEVLRALISRANFTLLDVEKIADTKRSNRGGFDENVLLLETRRPLPGAQATPDMFKAVGLHEVGEIQHRNNSGVIPLSRLIKPSSTASFVVEFLDHEVEVKLQLTSKGIEVTLGLKRAVVPGQLDFGFAS